MVLGMLFKNFKNVHILRYVIYEFLKKVLGGPRPTCLVRVHCARVEGEKWAHSGDGAPLAKLSDLNKDSNPSLSVVFVRKWGL